MSGPLHIAHVLPSFAWGGTQALIVLFAAEARSLGVKATVVSLAPDVPTPYAAQLRDLGAEVVFLPGRFTLDPLRLVRLARLIRQRQIDVVHAHLPVPNMLAPLAGLIARRPVVLGLHTQPGVLHGRSRLRGLLETIAVRRADAAISCATSIAQKESARLAPTPISVVSNATAIPMAPRPPRTADGPLRFITVGRLSPEKGYDVLIDAAARLAARGLPFHLDIIGDGHLRAALQRQIDDAGLQAHVTLLGPRADIPDLLAQADVFVLSSHSEGLSIALLEAMGSGLAVIATDVGDTATVVNPDVGDLVPPADPAILADRMAQFIAMPDRAVSCGAVAHRVIRETRAPGPWAQRYVDIYRNILAARAQRSA